MFVGIYFVFCALGSLQLANGAATNTSLTKTRRGGTVTVPEECKNQNYCTIKPDDYPQERINEIIREKYKDRPFQPEYVMTGSRRSGELEVDPSNTVSDCFSQVEYEPFFAVQSNGDWRTVIQAPEVKYNQIVRMEKCTRVGASCFKGFRVPLGLETICSQSYVTWEFLVYNEDEDNTKVVTVDLPSCCHCRHIRTAFTIPPPRHP
ncbi:hypothetical protein PYW08_001795 [Mythimna loreyi]|uniref:Uncharacterized protein n=1 Tax=Mythimna loreyi TaxID=667449 RepID=A0ACC2R763_9NEOP|nr:hypothetical protein PYW08_001795 [Mythimna loreyi]